MKKTLLISLFFLACCGFLHAQDKDAILNVLENQRQAWNKGDVEAFMQGYWKSDSLLFVGKTAPVHGWQTTLNNYKKNYPGKAGMGQLSFHILEVNVLDPDNAFVLGGWKLKRHKDSPGGYFTLWFRKINGEWKIVCDHTS